MTVLLKQADEDPFAIRTSGWRGNEPTRVLKYGESFAVFDHAGDMVLADHGLFHHGTRHLSRLQLRIAGHTPLLLSSSVRDENDQMTIDLTNPDIPLEDGGVFSRDLLHFYRCLFLWRGGLYERLRVVSYANTPSRALLSLDFDADFADIFEVRGLERSRRGEVREPRVTGRGLMLSYLGLDEVERRTQVLLSSPPAEMRAGVATWDLLLEAHRPFELVIRTLCECGDERASPMPFDAAHEEFRAELRRDRSRQGRIDSGNEQFSALVDRSCADLQMMITDTPYGLYPYAGVPWYSTIFGRDGLISAFEMLWADPSVARGVLSVLAATQATERDDERDAAPGKILHETRRGEMAVLGEIPFGRYYGTVDATPLFVFLAGEYWRRTADHSFIEKLWPSIEKALSWIDSDGDPDGDGFVEYDRRSENGLDQQGWKDSHDSVFHEDGSDAPPPIALCEVQAYVYGARLAAAEIAEFLGHTNRARALSEQARRLREEFERAFWLDDLSVYALALDGDKRPCRVVTSNAGQCLFTGIARPEHAARVAQRLMQEDSFSGWGIRTVAWDQSRYNPMGYHNGSVWPHDTALIGLGMARYGMAELSGRLLKGLFDASRFLDLQRLPELFCGFRRRPGEGPTLYPVACLPQAWAAGSILLLIQACLGLRINGRQQQIKLLAGRLPQFLPWLKLSNLMVGDAVVDLLFERHRLGVGISVLRREGDVQIVSVK